MRQVIRVEVESAGGDFAESFAAAQRNGQGDQLMLAAKLKSALAHLAIDFADVERAICFAQDDGRGLRDAKVRKANVAGFFRLFQPGDFGFEVSIFSVISRTESGGS